MSSDSTPGRPLRLYTADNEYVDMSTDTLVGQELNYYKGWLCGAGSESIYIDMDGKVFTASCRVGGCLGNVFEDIKIPENWIQCTRQVCSCGADLFIPKFQNETYKELLQKTFPNSNKHASSLKKTQKPFVAMERTHDSTYKQVYWEMGRRCNYDCSYCWPFIHNKTDPHKSLLDLLRATILVEETFLKGRPAHFVISGGEPTLNVDLMDWLKFIYSMDHKISIHSNGSRNANYYRKLIHYTNLNISVHFEFYNQERLLKVVEAVADEKFKNKGLGHFEVKIMMPPGLRSQALELEQKLIEIPYFVGHCTRAVVPIRDGNNGDLVKAGYEESDFELFGDRI
jgi:hypothetical protein